MPPAPPVTVGPGLLLFDVDRDGVEDVVGVFERGTPSRTRFLGAVSGVDGRVLWGLDPVAVESIGGDDGDSDGSLRALVGETLLVIDRFGETSARDAHSGELRWRRALPAPARNLCVHSESVDIRIATGSIAHISLVTGAEVFVPAGGPCEPAYISGWPRPGLTTTTGAAAGSLAGAAGAGWQVDRVLVSGESTPRVLLGTDAQSDVAIVGAEMGNKTVW